VVTHTCNPSYWGVRDKRILCSSLIQAKTKYK
jgi:hypothetical protein